MSHVLQVVTCMVAVPPSEAGASSVDASCFRALDRINTGSFIDLIVDVQRNVHCLVCVELQVKSLIPFRKLQLPKS